MNEEGMVQIIQPCWDCHEPEGVAKQVPFHHMLLPPSYCQSLALPCNSWVVIQTKWQSRGCQEVPNSGGVKEGREHCESEHALFYCFIWFWITPRKMAWSIYWNSSLPTVSSQPTLAIFFSLSTIFSHHFLWDILSIRYILLLLLSLTSQFINIYRCVRDRPKSHKGIFPTRKSS